VIVNNLISNAIKYYDTSKKEPFLEIFVQVNKNRAVIEFKDNGIGIDQEYVTKVFDMFFRATQNNNGAGLGLYIVKEAIIKLNGTIKIDSKLNEGSTFRIEMPNYTPGNKKYAAIQNLQKQIASE
jgi:signal transduction histidine kinase